MFESTLHALRSLTVVFNLSNLSKSQLMLPEGVDTSDMAAMRAYANQAPTGAKLFVLLAWPVGSFFGGRKRSEGHEE